MVTFEEIRLVWGRGRWVREICGKEMTVGHDMKVMMAMEESNISEVRVGQGHEGGSGKSMLCSLNV